MRAAPFKVCPCCRRAISKEEWGQLHLVGFMLDEVERLEMRNCVCNSTICISHPVHGIVASPPPETEART